MLIDWFTVGAQVLNFLVLLWLMKHFLYKPILNAIDVREKKIADEIENADKKMANAEKEGAEFKEKNRKFDKERAELLDKAVKDADKRHTELLDEVRKEIEGQRKKQLETLQNEQKSLSTHIQQRTQEEVFSIARKTLMDLADVTLEDRILKVFIHKISEISFVEKTDFALIRSSFEIAPEQKNDLELAVKEGFKRNISIRYEVSPRLVAGIELSSGGHRVSWSISDYLASLNEALNEVLMVPGEESVSDAP